MIKLKTIKIFPNVPFSSNVNQSFFWYAFFMAFPTIIIFQNISVYFFLYILLKLFISGNLKISISKGLQKTALFFSIGSVISTVGGYLLGGDKNLNNSLAVLPNYIYWSFIIIFLIQYRNSLDYSKIFKGITIGLITSIILYFIFKKIGIPGFFIINQLSQNFFAFLLICFTPISVYFISKKYGKAISFIFILFLSIIGFFSGSRTGSILVLTGALITFFSLGKINVSRIILTTFVGLMILFFIQSEIGESIIYDMNPRTYDLIYNTEETFDTDRSYLVRRAMVDKGLYLFYKNPLSGIGLNNFSATEGTIEGDFEGAQYIIHKNLSTGKSAHNSYISILSEGGVFLTVPFVLLLITIILFSLRKFLSMPAYYRPVFIGVLMMSVHLYFISAIVNVFAWFLLGLASALVYREKGVNRSRHRKQLLNIENKKQIS